MLRRKQNLAATTPNRCRGPDKRNLECFVVVVDDQVKGVTREHAFNRATWDDQAVDMNTMANELA